MTASPQRHADAGEALLATQPGRRLRFDRDEWAGAFGDLGTLVPFLVAYIGLAGLDPTSLLFTFGVALVFVGFAYRTPFPVQPMKAAGAIVATQAAAAHITPSAVHAAALVTGLLWLLLGATGAMRHVSRLVAPPVAHGLVLGLGVAFMLEGIAAMVDAPWLGVAALVVALVLLRSRAVPAMFVLLAAGAVAAVVDDPQLLQRLAEAPMTLSLPTVTLGSLSLDAFAIGALVVALPQLPLTLGNAVIAVTEANNRQFPDRPASESKVAVTTGVMNLFSGALGGVPMCHGAGGLAAQVRFGARTGGAPVLLGCVLLVLSLAGSAWILMLLEFFPRAILGVLLFLAGLQLASGARGMSESKGDRLLMLMTAAFAIWHVGAAFVVGVIVHLMMRRGWVRL